VSGQIYLRTSERADFRRCPMKWWWAWREGLVSKRPPSGPLWFGSLVHEALAAYYVPGLKRGPHPAETFEQLCDDEVRWFKRQYPNGEFAEDEYISARGLGIAMLTGYVEHWKGDPNWKVLRAEQSAEVAVRRNYHGAPTDSYAVYGMTLDGVVRDLTDGQLKMIEHKTAATIQTNHLFLDSQAGAYWAFGTLALRREGVLQDDEVISCVQYNFLRKAKPDDRPRNAEGHALNKDGSVSKKQPLPYFVRPEPVHKTRKQVNTQIQAIQNELWHMDAMRNGDLPLYKSPVAVGPQACAGCQFREMCELHESGGDWEEYQRYAYEVRDPYVNHRDR
jgi:hypothetical protein